MEANADSGRLDHVLPSPDILERARCSLLSNLPTVGHGESETKRHLEQDIVPALNGSSRSRNYYGFVTGGASPAAALADHLVTEHDQNLSVHLPQESVATNVEDRALSMLCELLKLTPTDWKHRTFTTGATASNLVGLACGREKVIQRAGRRNGSKRTTSIAEDGIVGALQNAGLEMIQVLTTVPHSSLRKAASIIGLGRANVIDVGRADAPHRFDFDLLEQHLAKTRCASIIAVSCAEVNTGFFATSGAEMKRVRELADRFEAWVHVDAAFGLLARVLPDHDEYAVLRDGVAGIELADSITGDAHKLCNVPYDCGIFMSRDLDIGLEVFKNPNAAYLNSRSTGDMIPPPLNIGIENSRRFRALPVYASLSAYGSYGFCEMLERQIRLSREIARLIVESKDYVLLPEPTGLVGNNVAERLQAIYIIVLFRARDDHLNDTLVKRLNRSRRLYVSGTQWAGKPAARFAVSNWQVNVEHDIPMIADVLKEALQD